MKINTQFEFSHVCTHRTAIKFVDNFHKFILSNLLRSNNNNVNDKANKTDSSSLFYALCASVT